MMSLIIDITDVVAAELNAADPGTFSQDFTAARMVLPKFELSELADLKVTVVPKAVGIAGASRATCRYDYRIDIGIQKKVSKDTDGDVKALCTLVDEIVDYLRRRQLAQAPNAVWVETQNDPPYAPEHLAEQRAFTSVLTLTYRVIK